MGDETTGDTTARDYLETLKVARRAIPQIQQKVKLLEKELAYAEAVAVDERIRELGGDIKQFGANEEARERAKTLLLDSNNTYLAAWENLEQEKFRLEEMKALRDNAIDEITVWKYEVRERFVQVSENDVERDFKPKRATQVPLFDDFPVQQ